MKPVTRSCFVLATVAGLAISGAAAARQENGALDPHRLYLRAAQVNTSIPVTGLAARRDVKGARVVIQLDGPITPLRRATMEAAGIRIGDFLPVNAYIVTLDRADARAVGALDFIRWHGEYQNAWKLDPEIGKRAAVAPERQALAARGGDRVTIVTFPDANIAAVQRSVLSIPGTQVISTNPIGDRFEIVSDIAVADAPRLAAIDGIQFIEPTGEVQLRSNYNVRWIVQSNVAGTFPVYTNGIHGEGQIVGIIDEQVNVQHCSFVDAVNPVGPLHRKIVAYSGAQGYGFHGTHVGGTAAGDGGNDTADTRGVAYAGKIAYGGSYNGALTEAGFYSAATFDHAAGARVHTNSWGNDGTTSYDGLCRGIDRFAYDNEESLVLFAVSNGSIVTNPENAKNCLGTGATGPVGQQETMCYGGTGPTGQGLRRPEIWAPGCSTLSSTGAGVSCLTASASGTSMSSPALAGTALLVRQYFTAGYYPMGINSSGPSVTPSGALMRAVLLNSGQNMTGGVGYPGVRENWGRARIDDPLFFPGDARKLLVKDVRNSSGLSTGASDDVNVQVLGSGQPLRITLVFTEPAATAGAGAPTINNLDLEVIDPASTVYKGNVFNTAAGESTTGGTADALNTAEQVLIASPTSGNWVVRVRGTSVAQGTQGFAVVATGDITPGAPPPLAIGLPAGVPALVPPGVPTDIAVRVIPGSQAVVPGSPTMHYRLTGTGAFATQQLISLGGNDYRATLPSLLCENTPQFYFSVLGNGGATALSPGNAPTSIYSTSIGTTATNTLLTVDFDLALPVGWSGTGMWHLTDQCAPTGTPCAGARSAYYGQDATCTFATGTTSNTGTLTSSPIILPSVPAGGSINLSFCSALVTENLATWDNADVLVNGVIVTSAGESASWTTINADLTSYAGQTVTLAFRFDTGDGQFNNFRGWHVDDIRITATGVGCTNPPAACYANCDLSSGSPILTANDFVCFINAFAGGQSYANCDGSSGVPLLTANDFVCFINAYATGCT